MSLQKYRWLPYTPIPPQIEDEFVALHPIIRQLLYNRNITSLDDAKRFLDARPPHELKGTKLLNVEESARRINQALESKEQVAVYGDFDVDGITATAVVKSALSTLGTSVASYIPDRSTEGYGLNLDAIKWLHDQGADLLITVDCGIRAVDEVQVAKDLGMSVIITDHHMPGSALPAADFIVNPNQEADPYPNKDLAGVGVAFKMIQSLSEFYPQLEPEKTHLDLVALGTIADLVPLTGENRHLAKRGLRQLKRPRRQGILSLMGAAGISPESLQASDISFQLAPRLNAAGRLSSANRALDLLLEEDVHQAGTLAQEIEILNTRRKSIMKEMNQLAEKLAVPEGAVPPILFAFHANFNQGIVGLAAGYLADKFHRPAVVGKIGAENTVASCRSIEDFNIIQALDVHRDLFQQYGGHPAAAGFTIQNNRLPELQERLSEYAQQKLQTVDLTPTMAVDAEVRFDELDYQFLSYLNRFSPMGYGNPKPLFLSTGVSVKKSRQVGKGGDHLKLTVNQQNKSFDAIAFRWGHLYKELPPLIDILFTFEENEYRGRSSLQLNIKDFRPGQP